MYLPLDGPSVQDAFSVTTATVKLVIVGGSALDERKAVTLQPTNGNIYLYFGDASVAAPSAATVIAKGFLIYSGNKESYEASGTQPIYIVAATATTNVIIAERA